jgi:hypothetical protein
MGLFDTDIDFSSTSNTYDQSMQKILAMIDAAQKSGRSDISDYLQKAFNLNQPYMKAGGAALSELQNSLGIGDQGAKGPQGLMQKFQQSPGYQYALKQAQNATTAHAAATGQNLSGAEQLQLQSNAQGEANQDWSNWLNNYQNRLSGIAGMGQSASAQTAGLEAQGGENLANLGLQYTGMSAQTQEDMAKAKAEAEMAQEEADAESSNSMWGTIGTIGGAILAGPIGAAAGNAMFGGTKSKSSGGAVENEVSNMFNNRGFSGSSGNAIDNSVSGMFGGSSMFGGGSGQRNNWLRNMYNQQNQNDYSGYGGYQGYQNWLQTIQ